HTPPTPALSPPALHDALPISEATHDVRSQDLAALRVRGDARSHDHGCAEEVAPLFDRLAGVQADANVYRFLIGVRARPVVQLLEDRKSTRLNSSHQLISYAVV